MARKTYCVLCCFTVQEKQAIIKVTGNDGHELVESSCQLLVDECASLSGRLL